MHKKRNKERGVLSINQKGGGQDDGIAFTSQFDNASLVYLTDDGRFTIGTSRSTNYKLVLNCNNGFVGIGTSDPDKGLHIYGSNNDESAIKIQNIGDVGGPSNQQISAGLPGLRTDGLSITDRITNLVTVRIDADGNVGLGTDYPGSKLAVVGRLALEKATIGTLDVVEHLRFRNTFSDRQLQFYEFTNGGARYHTINYNLRTEVEDNQIKYYQGNWSGSTRISFEEGISICTDAQVSGGSEDQITPTERLRIKWNGNIGIGTTEPTDALHVVGSIRATGPIFGNTYSVRMESDDPAAYQTSYSTDEDGNQVAEEVYNGTTEDLLAIIKDLRTRLAAVESNTLQPVYSTFADLPSASDHHGKTAHVHSEGALYFAHAGNWVKLQNA